MKEGVRRTPALSRALGGSVRWVPLASESWTCCNLALYHQVRKRVQSY